MTECLILAVLLAKPEVLALQLGSTSVVPALAFGPSFGLSPGHRLHLGRRLQQSRWLGLRAGSGLRL